MTDIRPTVEWCTTNSWPICHQHMTDSQSRCVVEISTNTRPIVYPTIDWLLSDCQLTIEWLSTDCRPTIDWLSTGSRPLYRPSLGRVSTDYRPLYRPLYRPIDQSTLPTVNKIWHWQSTWKKHVSVAKHGFGFWAQCITNAKLEIYEAFQDHLTFLNRHMLLFQISWIFSICQIYWE